MGLPSRSFTHERSDSAAGSDVTGGLTFFLEASAAGISAAYGKEVDRSLNIPRAI
jgi:hypothetical protein